MGYCYTNGGALCCDSCGKPEGTRKRICPHKVEGLPYCPAPALCSDCYKREGGVRIHDRCKEPAAKLQIEENERRRRLEAGGFEVRAAWGSWHETVPEGFVGVLFRNKAGAELYRLIQADEYSPPGEPRPQWLDEYPAAIEWKRPAA